ncbi:MAG: hypothetical protein B0A82_26635 [Alkalinema sp. CACIAM 70d]|nr:MAG: hypothetical protein B0A82_26635 [Alkalinema sp. CACIAM 70d]
MLANNPHQIIRQVLELELSHTDQAFELQEAVARLFQGQGRSVMESVFDQIAGPEERVRVERLEIDLGMLQGSDWMTQFSQRLATQLQSNLEQILHSSAAQTTPDSSIYGSKQDGWFQQFLFFCEHGRLPWWRRKPSDDWLETLQSAMTPAQWRSLAQLLSQDARALRRLIYTVSDEFLQTLLQILNDLPESATVLRLMVPGDLPHTVQALWRERFWLTVLPYCISPTAVSIDGPRLMQYLWTERQTLLQTDSTHTPETGISPTGSDNREATESRSHPPTPLHSHATPQSGNITAIELHSTLPQPWQTWMEYVTPFPVPSPLPSTTDAGSAILAQQPDSSPLPPPPETKPTITGVIEDQPMTTAPLQPTAKPAMTGTAEGQTDAQSTNPLPTPSLTAPGQALKDGVEEQTVAPTLHSVKLPGDRSPHTSQPSVSQKIQGLDAIETAESKAVYIGGTGIVIVHPFLQELFHSLELLADNQFRDGQTQRRAVALLTYLTYGDANIPEYELLLPKLLCAWDWEEPLPPYELNEAERNACEELLGAVLKHWSALHSNSTEWLRQQFFWRDGKLKPVDLGWQLTIEHRMQDVLLSKLPWGVGVIHLPWMPVFLHVNWTT